MLTSYKKKNPIREKNTIEQLLEKISNDCNVDKDFRKAMDSIIKKEKKQGGKNASQSNNR